MTKNIYMVYFYTGITPKEIEKVLPFAYVTEGEAETNAKKEVEIELPNYNSPLKYKILKLELCQL